MVTDLLIILGLLLLTGIWIYALREREEAARKRIGRQVEVVMLVRRGVKVFYYILGVIGLGLPVVTLWMIAYWNRDVAQLLPDLSRMVWLGSLAYGLRQGSRFLIGEHGFSMAQRGFTPWEKVEEVKWDRDIGQRSWGVLIVLKGEKRGNLQRIYVPRELKEHLERLFAEYRGIAASAPDVVRNVSPLQGSHG